MRKKLLALLMCATMVLGTGVTAFADNYDDADKVLTSWKGFANEYADSESAITVSVGSSKYAFTTKDHTNGITKFSKDDYVKVNSSNKELLYVGDAIDLTKYGTIGVYAGSSSSLAAGDLTYSSSTGFVGRTDADTQKINISIVLQAYAADQAGVDVKDAVNSKTYDASTLTDLGITADGVIVKVMDNQNAVHVAWLVPTVASSSTQLAATNKAATWDLMQIDLVSSKKGGKTIYKTDDGYSFTENKGTDASKFFKAIKATSEDGYTYAYQLTEVEDTDADFATLETAVAVALKNGALSTDARAARVTLYQYGVAGDEPFLKEVTNPIKTVSIPVANDLLSQTGLKAATVDAYFVTSTEGYDEEEGKYNVLGNIDSSLDASAAYKTFALPLNFASVDGSGLVVIFDKSADESQNDGVASEETTTTAPASETAASSPKTGDVAPIAALAVVMMGACGAMVVASKKRA